MTTTMTNGSTKQWWPVGRKKLVGDKWLTTGRIATLCGVAPRMVVKWCDSGALKHHRIPPGLDRRIAPADLIEFLDHHGNPIPPELLPPAVLVVGCDWPLGDHLDDWQVVYAATPFAAGVAATSHYFAAVVLDAEMGRSAAEAVACGLRACLWAATARFVWVESEDVSPNLAALAEGWDAVLWRPDVTAREIAKAVTG